MGRIQAPKTIRTEDFPAEQQEMVGKLAFILNTFMDQVFSLTNGNIYFANLAQSIRTITVTTNGSGVAQNLPIRLSSDLNRRVVGIVCVSARNVQDSTIFVATQPFLSFTSEIGQVRIQNIGGLPSNSTLSLTLLLIGE